MSITQSALSALDRALFSLKDSISFHNYKKSLDVMRNNLPYALHPTSQPDIYIMVNRNYKPIGSSADSGFPYVDYDAFPSRHVRLTQKQIQSLAISHVDGVYFLSDDLIWESKSAGRECVKRMLKLRERLV
jgi:hypothetical protein